MMTVMSCSPDEIWLGRIARGKSALRSAAKAPELRQNVRWRCLKIPDSVTQGRMVGVVVPYIEAQLDKMHESFRSLALEEPWLCRS
jgi:hypothetical protein